MGYLMVTILGFMKMVIQIMSTNLNLDFTMVGVICGMRMGFFGFGDTTIMGTWMLVVRDVLMKVAIKQVVTRP